MRYGNKLDKLNELLDKVKDERFLRKLDKEGFIKLMSILYKLDYKTAQIVKNKWIKYKIEELFLNALKIIWIVSIIFWLIMIVTSLVFGDYRENKVRVNKTSILNCVDYKWVVKFAWYTQAVLIYKRQCDIINEYIRKWQITITEALDLLAIRSMECNAPDGRCFNWYDVGPFQINRIHKEAYYKSWKLWNNKEWLFRYQLGVALWLIRVRMKNLCDRKRSKTNERRFKCLYKTYNWYKWYTWWLRSNLARLKRKMIKKVVYGWKR